MSRAHVHRNCSYGQDGNAFTPSPEPQYAPGQDADRDRALESFAHALEALPDPVTACAKELTAEDVQAALTASPQPERSRMLRGLGLKLSPRTIGSALSRDVLNRMLRAGLAERRHVADRLAGPVYRDMLIAAMAPADLTESATIKLKEHDERVLRFSLWAVTLPGAACARVIVWAFDQPWFAPAGATPEQLEAVRDAAQDVVTATPGFDMFADLPQDTDTDLAPGPDTEAHANTDTDPDSGSGAEADTDEVVGEDALEGDDGDLQRAAEDDEPMATAPAGDRDAASATSAEPGASSALPGDVPTEQELVAAIANLEGTFSSAAAYAHDVADGLDAGRPPAPGTVAAIDAAAREFETVERHLRAAGAGDPERSLAGLRQSLEALSQRQDEAALRSGLEAFAALDTTDETLRPALVTAVARAEALLATMVWSGTDRDAAQALTTLAEMTRGDLEPSQLLEAQSRVVGASSDLALLAVRSSALRPNAATTTASGTAPTEETQPEPTDDAPDEAPNATGEAATADEEQEHDPAPAADESANTADDDSTPTGSSNIITAHPATVPSPEPAPETGTEPQVPQALTPPVSQDDPQPEPQMPAAVTMDRPVAVLISQGRHALAAELSARCDTPPIDPELLRASALAAAVRTPHGQVATALTQRITAMDAETIAQNTAALLVSATALLRTALVTGEPTAGALLLALQPHLGERLGTLASEVGRRAVTGVLVDSPPLTALADVTETERVLADAQNTARELLRPRRMRFKRATDMVNGWLAPEGMIGAALTAVVDDARDKVELVNETIDLLGNPTEVSKLIEAEDRQLRTTSGKALQGAARTDLLAEAAKSIPTLSQWVDAVASLAVADRSARWSTTEVADMRSAVLASGPAALTALTDRSRDGDPLAAAAAVSAHQSLTHTLALLDGAEKTSSVETPPAAVLGLDLLRVAGAQVDVVTGQVALGPDVTQADLTAALERTWDQAVRVHVEQENFAAAHYLIRSAQAGMLGPDPGISPDTAALVTSHEHTARKELDWQRTELGAELRDARRNNQISEEQDSELTALLRDTERVGDVATVRAMLDQISRSLPDYRARAASVLRDRLAAIKDVNSKATDDDLERVAGFIDRGDLGTAEELIYLLETNEVLPTPHDHEDLARFFPAVPDALPDGITNAVIAIARERGTVASCPTLDFSGLSPDQATLTADALEGWRALATTPADKRYNISETDLLLPALRIAGLEAKKTIQLTDAPRAKERRFVDVGDVTVNGKAMVPAFGSAAGDRRRILLAWGRPSADTLISWVDQDPAAGPVIVAYFGTMTSQVRRELAAQSPRSGAPMIVLDDAALAYLAAHGDRLLEPTMRILLPFAQLNPYVHEKRGLVAPEMFYGRKAEQRKVVDPQGTQIIYGGRGLGKSALLRDAEAQFESASPVRGSRVAVYMSLDDLHIGAGKSVGAEAVWEGLLGELTRRGVIAPKGGPRTGGAHNKVVTGVTTWLDADSTRGLLILLDESDRFFEADSPNFLETSRLRNLGTQTRNRAKVVFAGLHSVQRFTKVANNGPFSHLAQRPTVIGPLRPQHALDLLTEPMAALGYEFEEPDLVNRVLTTCSYQPFLLQMFGHRLVQHMSERRAETGAQPPYLVTRADIETVEANEELLEDIGTAFRDTLNLDPRYNVIANVMARNAHQSGLEARMTDTQLREECLDWWEEGFTTLDTAAFRSYLNEMVGLGVLARNSDGRGWRLRGPAVLTMVGTPSDVDTQLLGANTESLRDDFIALASRAELGNGRYSPLTAGQMDDLLGHHSTQLRVVLGSTATGVQEAVAAVQSSARNGFTVLPVNSRSAFETALTAGEPGERRVVVSDLRGLDPEVCEATLRAAVERIPDRPGVTRSVVLVAGAHQLPFWREVITAETTDGSVGTVALSRHDVRTLRVWSMTTQRFSTTERMERLLAVTGGWPFLVERATASATQASKEPAVLDELEAHLATPEGAAELVDAVGLRLDPMTERAYGDLVTLIGSDDSDLTDLQLAAAESTTEASEVISCLQALGVFTRTDTGKYRLEPVLARAWAQSVTS